MVAVYNAHHIGIQMSVWLLFNISKLFVLRFPEAALKEQFVSVLNCWFDVCPWMTVHGDTLNGILYISNSRGYGTSKGTSKKISGLLQFYFAGPNWSYCVNVCVTTCFSTLCNTLLRYFVGSNEYAFVQQA